MDSEHEGRPARLSCQVSSDLMEKRHQRMDDQDERLSNKKLCEGENRESIESLNSIEATDSPELLSRAKKAAQKEEKAPGIPSHDAARNSTCMKKTKFDEINDQLSALGFHHSEEIGNCARAAIYNGFIEFTGKPSDLEQVIVPDTLMCGHKCDAKLKDLLKQPDYAGIDYEMGLQEATVICTECDSEDEEFEMDESRTYVTRICEGYPRFNCGKFHNHCTNCELFGDCIGDYRERHCHGCGGHYFAGFAVQFSCPQCGDSDSDSEVQDDCGLM